VALPAPIEQFGKYQILERIARGGMAEIFKARMEGIGGFHRLYAIKRILPSLSTNRDYIDMLVDEAKIAGLLSHANIVQILDLGQVDGQYYVAMELVDGPDLGQILERCRQRGITLPVPQAVFVLIEVLKGLEYAHKRQILRGNKPVPLNIVHRDVSPSNVLVSLQGEVKLTDFGIAKANVKALETLSGVIKGKFDYMSPEQASGEDVDPRTDLFAAGVLFYELLCGTHPFHQKSEIKTIEAIRRGEYTPPSAVNAVVDYPLEVIIDRALARDREARYATATEFKDALNRYAHDAGFIFTPATLAGFLKGLFPESAKLKRTPTVTSLRDQETRPLPVNGGPLVEDDEDRSTDHSGKAPPPNAGRDDTITRTNLGPPLRPPAAPAPPPAQPVAARPAPPAPPAPPRPAAPPRPPAPAAPAGVGVTPRLNTAPPAARPVAAAPAAPVAPARPPAAPIAPPPAESPPTRPPSRLPPRRTRDVAPSGFFDPRMFGEEQDPLSPGAPPQKIPEGLSGRRNLAGATRPPRARARRARRRSPARAVAAGAARRRRGHPAPEHRGPRAGGRVVG
jgi:serine/threonine protein kinase